MRTTIITISFAFFSLITLSQKVYYVQDKAYNINASDMNPGTDINYPWATWQKAFNTADAGDTVYFRGGIWYPTSGLKIFPEGGIGHNGTYNKPICFFNFPGERPIVDFRNLPATTSSRAGLDVYRTTYLKFKGLTFKSVYQTTYAQWIAGIGFVESGVIHLENLVSTDNGGAGYRIAGYDTLYLINCDSYNNIDSTTTSTIPGGRSDGYTIGSGGTELDTFKIAYISGCRAWLNSDDGFDVASTKQLQIDNCWSFRNGRLEGDGTGFKLEYSHVLTPSKRRIINCVTSFNRRPDNGGGGGFADVNLYDENFGIFMEYYNISSYKDWFGFSTGPGLFTCGEDPASAIYRNDLVYGATNEPTHYQAGFKACNYGYPTYVTQDHNTWTQMVEYWQTAPNPLFTVTDDDFRNLDTAQLRWPRKADGSLPDITFMRLKDGSDLIDAGIDLGVPYNGNAPDIGAFEYEMAPGTTNRYPSVIITYPVQNDVLTNYNNSISTMASDPDGTISKVEFFLDDKTKIGEAVTAPFSIECNDIPLGNHSLRAVATDNLGAKSTSQRVQVTITPGGIKSSDAFILFPNPTGGSLTLFMQSPLKYNSIISILSVDGKTICTDTMTTEERIKQFNLSLLKPGLYLFMLASSDVYFTKMFVKQ